MHVTLALPRAEAPDGEGMVCQTLGPAGSHQAAARGEGF